MNHFNLKYRIGPWWNHLNNHFWCNFGCRFSCNRFSSCLFYLLLWSDPFYCHSKLLAVELRIDYWNNKWIYELWIFTWDPSFPRNERLLDFSLGSAFDRACRWRFSRRLRNMNCLNLLGDWFWDGQPLQVHKLAQFTQLIYIPMGKGG